MSDLKRTEIKYVDGLKPEGAHVILELAARMEMGLPLSFRGDKEIGFNMEVLESSIGLGSTCMFEALIDHTGHGCGTVACWMGHLNIALGPEYEQKVIDHSSPASRPLHDGLTRLFYPPDCDDWNGITTRQAAKAGRNFVEFGEPRWEQVLAEGG